MYIKQLAKFIGLALVVLSCSPHLHGVGNPVLLISSGSNPFSAYTSEILKAEGIAYDTVDLSALSAATLGPYDVAVLGHVTLSSAHVSTLTTWVNNGGRLVALRPDKQLAGLLGLADTSTTLSNGYLLVNTGSAPGAGIVGQTIQFHGTADLYNLSGAIVAATLYSNASTPTSYPAVSIRTGIGSGGMAAAFTYDLARSVVYTRQGNPAWAGQARVNQGGPIRAGDMFYGAASFDPQPDWIDLSKVSIPQADEQQRLLVNLLLHLSQGRKPIPRFWYLPFGKKAAVVMTGDDHANGATAGRFDYFNSVSPQGCSVANWECVRAGSYIYPNTPITNTQAANYTSQGFEIGVHVNTGCASYTPQSLESFYANDLSAFAAAFPSVPAPVTNRTHCIAWSDWSTQATVSLAHGIRLDTNYYYWPPSWVLDRPGFFTGSGIPMRFAQQDGTTINVYQAATQMTDESGQSYPLTINSLLDNAIGPSGYYGVFTANIHTDSNVGNSQLWAEQIVASAQARGVPVVSAKQILQWLDGRDASSFSNISFSGNTLSFSVAAASGANGLQAMLPFAAPTGGLTSLTRGGTPVTYTIQTVKGVDYAFFTAVTGTYSAIYSSALPPIISAVTVTPGINSATITWTTDKLSNSRVDYGATPGSLTLSQSDSSFVTNHSVTLSGLTQASAYYFRVTSVDSAGGTATSPSLSIAPASFATIDPNPPVISAISATPGTGGTATIAWTTNKLATTRVDYGTSPSTLNLIISNGTMVTSHSINLTGLTSGATYYFRVTSVDSLGGSSTSPASPAQPASFVQIPMFSVWSSTATPGVVDSGDAAATEVGMRIRSDVAGSITAIRFYKSVANTGAHVGNIWTSTGTLLGSVTFANETASGWQQATLATPVSIAANTTYIVSYHAPNGRYSSDENFFAVNGVDNGPLRALRNGLDGPNGVYIYSATSAFPTQTFNSSNYWVDVVFTEANLPPLITGVSAATAPTTATITWSTNKASTSRVDYGTSPTSLTLNVSNGSLVTAHSVSLGGLVTGTTYYYRVTSVDGQGLSSTSPPIVNPPASFVPSDTTPPVISGVTAAPAAVSATVNWTTNEVSNSRVDYGLSPTSLTLSVTDAALVSTHSVILPGLLPATTYYYQVTSTDAAGNSASTPTGTPLSFITIDNIPPVITSVTATSGLGGMARITWTTGKMSNSRVDYGTAPDALTLSATDPAQATAHVISLTGLVAGTTYYYRVTSVDSAGNSTTAPDVPNVPASYIHTGFATIWSSLAAPSVVDSGDSTAVELGLKFRSDAPGLVKGIRFYKAAANTGTHVGNLWSSTGALLGSVTFTNETASGWQQADFLTPIPISANTTYIASYHAPNGRYSFNSGLFSSSGVDTPPLHALANGVDGPNGVFRYGPTSVLPDQSYNASNYWVDVVLTEDNLPPLISSLAATPTETAATVTWTTNKLSTSRVDFGTSPNSLSQNVSNPSMVTAHSIALTGLITGTTYFYRVTSVDSQGNSTTWPAPTNPPLSFTPPDTTAPIISSVTATPGSTSATIAWTTNENSNSRVDFGISPSALNQSANDPALVTSHSISLTSLATATTYYYRVTSTDAVGNNASSPTGTPASFATIDPNPPVITSIVATPGAGGTATITWTTNKLSNSRVDYGTSAGTLNLNLSNASHVTSHSITLTGLTGWTTYYFRVTSADALGNSATSPVAPNPPASFVQTVFVTLWSSTATPATIDEPDSSPVELGMRFRSDSPGTVTAIRFYKSAANTGTHIGNLWTNSGTRLGSVTFTNESSSGWQQANFPSPITIAPNTTYVVSYFAPAGRYSTNANFFASSGVDNPPLRALANGIDGPNGVYKYSPASTFPDQSFNATNYWVDLVFVEENAPPIVSAVSSATTPTSATITWTTNKNSNSRVDYGTSPTNLNLNVTDSAMVTAHTINLTGLTTGVTYYYRVSSVDAQGNSTTSPVLTNPAASFVPSIAAQPKSIWTSTATPAQIDSGDTAAVELGMKFRSDIPGYVSGVRFFKSAANSGLHVGHLWSANGVLLSTATFSNETASGWQQANFPGQIPILANTTYIISYFAPNGHYSGNEGFFTTSGVDNAPLRALRSGVEGPNGVYQYGSGGGFPNQAYNDTNYWVDVVFLSDDGTPPTVTNFTIPATSSTLVVPITTFTASDNNAVTGYLVTESATVPSPVDGGWTSSPPTSYGFSSAGSKTLYAWAKDGAQFVSSSRSASVVITLIDVIAPTVTTFALPATATSLTVPITSLAANDNVGVTGYLINESATAPLPGAAGWSGTPPTSYTFTTSGIKTLYAWAKDAAGNVSTSRSAAVTITLSTDGPEPPGWYTGDIHVHSNCGSTPEATSSLLSKMSLNNLSAISLLADNGNGEVQIPSTDLPRVNGQDDPISIPGRIVHWDAEWHWDATYTQYAHQALGGHILALGLTSAQQVWEESTYSILNWAHQRSAIAGFAHLQYLPSGFPTSLTCCTPIEYPVEVALGAADFISEDVDDSDSPFSMNPDAFIDAYYKLLNTGFRPGFAAGTDYPCNSGRPLGALLTYAQPAGGSMTYRNYINAIAAGRTVIARNGHNEFLNLIVNGTATPGDQINLAASGSVNVTVQWLVRQNLSGTIELVSNGAVVASNPMSAAPGSPALWSTTLSFPKSGWLAARRMGADGHQIHTAAVFVIVNGAPIRASAADAQFYVQWMDSLLTRTAQGGEWGAFYPTQRALAHSRYQAAKALFAQIATEAASGSTTPVLASILPSSAGPGASVQVTLYGTNLSGAAVNSIDGVAVTVTGSTSTSLTATFLVSPTAATGTRNVVVTTAAGVSNALTFTINPGTGPTLTSINPNSGVQGATVAVTISGANLTGATLNLPSGVSVSGTPSVGATQIAASLAIGANAAVGPQSISVTSVGGTSNPLTFTVNPAAPTLVSITPSSGVQSSTVAVTISGANLTGATLNLPSGVSVSGTPSVGATQIVASLAIGANAAVGLQSISVTTAGGTSNSLAFTINTGSGPTLTSINPNSGVQGATVAVTISGVNLSGATLNLPLGVTLSGTPTVSATQITATLAIAANAALGSQPISVTTAGGTSNSLTFSVNPAAPTLVSITPNSGVQGATVAVTISGANLTGATLNLPSGVSVSGTPTMIATQITASLAIAANAAVGPQSISVTTAGGTSNALTFTVNPVVPSLTSITPASGRQGASVQVTLNGSNLVGVAVDPIPGISISVTNSTATSITATFAIEPSAATGARTVTVTSTAGTSNAVTFTVNAGVPTLVSISPSSGVQGSSFQVTLAGTYLTGATVGAISGVTISATTSTPTSVTATFTISNTAALGNRNVSVTTAGGTSNGLTFTVNQGVPTITSLSPTSGRQGASVSLVVNGTILSGGALNLPTGLTVSGTPTVTSTRITATILIAANTPTGAQSISVTTPGGRSNDLTFTVLPSVPTLTSISPTTGYQGRSVQVILTGTNLLGATVTAPTGITVTDTVSTPTTVTATFSISYTITTGNKTIRVTTAGGTSNGVTFTVATATPAITSASPTALPRGAATTVTINGQDFTPTTTVLMSPSTAITIGAITFISGSQIIVPITVGASATPGSRSLSVRSGGLNSNTVAMTIQ